MFAKYTQIVFPMIKTWRNFISNNNGVALARDAFEDLCFKILDKHFPGKAVVPVSEMDKSSSEKLNVLYVCKLFTDHVSDSRKSQIRSSFNNFVTYQKEHDIKTYVWILCISHQLDENEMHWWNNWHEKMTKEHQINIELFDSNKIIELSKQYELYEDYFEQKKEEIIDLEIEELSEIETDKSVETKEEDDLIEFTIIEPPKQKNKDKKEQKQERKPKEKTEKQDENQIKQKQKPEKRQNKFPKKQPKNKAENKEENKQETEKTENNLASDNKKDNNSQLNKNNNRATPEKQFTKRHRNLNRYDSLKRDYDRILAQTEKFSKAEKLKLEKIFSLKKEYENLFTITDKLDDLNHLMLFYKARSYEIRYKLVPAIFVYEYLLKKEPTREKITEIIGKVRVKEVYISLANCHKKAKATLWELEGDINRIKNNAPTALQCYEKSHQLDKTNNLYIKKYYETLGDLEIEKENPEKAYDCYKKIQRIDRLNEEINRKKINAAYLMRAQKANKKFPRFIFSRYYYSKALKEIESEQTEQKLSMAKRKNLFALAGILLFTIIAVFGIFNWIYYTPPQATHTEAHNTNRQASVQKTNQVMPITSLDQVAIAKGDRIMQNISIDKIHLIDTAIAAYKRALDYGLYNHVAHNKLKEAENYKKIYLSNAQKNILLDSNAYFVSMRRTTENLQLFKYIYDQNNRTLGKYGYVDSLMNIVIPPFYDFDYNRMYNGKEFFKDKKALVCLIHSRGDTNYYQINTKNRILSKL